MAPMGAATHKLRTTDLKLSFNILLFIGKEDRITQKLNIRFLLVGNWFQPGLYPSPLADEPWRQLCTLHDWWLLPWIPLFLGGSLTPCRPKFSFVYHACLVLRASFFSSAWSEKQEGSCLPLLSYILSRVNSHYHLIKHHACADSSQIYFCSQHVSLGIPCVSLTCPVGISTWVLYNQSVSYINILMSHEHPKNEIFHVYDFEFIPLRLLWLQPEVWVS